MLVAMGETHRNKKQNVVSPVGVICLVNNVVKYEQ